MLPATSVLPMRIIHIEDNPRDAAWVGDLLSTDRPECAITVVSTRDDFLRHLSAGGYELIISDYSLPGFDGIEALQLARERAPDIPFVFLSGTLGEERAIEAVHAGAADYVVKDRMQRLPLVVERVIREAAEQRVQRERERSVRLFRSLLDRSNDVFELLDPATGRYLDVSEKGCIDLGYTLEELQQLKVFDIDPTQTPETLARGIAVLRAKENASLTLESLHRRKNGSTFPVEISVTLVTLDREYLVVVVRDITEKKLLEEQFLRAQRLESLGMLAAGISHDLNNVLVPVLMGAQILRQRVTDQLEMKVLDNMESSVERGSALVRQILSFAHGVSGDREVVVQMKHILRDIESLIGGTFPRNIQVRTNWSADLWTLLANPTQLHQVLLNLCVNARDAMPQGGALRIAAENRMLTAEDLAKLGAGEPGPYVLLEVADTGTGIAPDVLERMWSPFFTTKAEGKGTGLGLATVRGIVTSHKGFIQVETALGGGSVFRIWLPAEGVYKARAGAEKGG